MHIFKRFFPTSRWQHLVLCLQYEPPSANPSLLGIAKHCTSSKEVLICLGGKESTARTAGRQPALIFTLVFRCPCRIPAPAEMQAAPGSSVPSPAGELLPWCERWFSGEPFEPTVVPPVSPVMLCFRQTPVGLLSPNKTIWRRDSDRLVGSLWLQFRNI